MFLSVFCVLVCVKAIYVETRKGRVKRGRDKGRGREADATSEAVTDGERECQRGGGRATDPDR